MLFVTLIVRLGVVQIVQGEEFSKEVSKTESDYASFPAPRGKMVDRYGRVLVDNKDVPAITYTVDKTTKASEKIDTAQKLANLIKVPTDFLLEKDRDLQDYWLAANPEEAKELLSEKEIEDLKPADTYKLQIKRVPKKELTKIRNDEYELEVAAIYTRFSSGYSYEPQIVKSTELTDKEVSIVAENLESLPGIDVITDWDRVYPYEATLRPLFGSVTTPEQGILQERSEYYTSRGYARNDRVGKSYLEYQYEDYLNPRKARVEYISDNSGNIISEKVIDEGERGHDLKLSFDVELQKRVDEIVEGELRSARSRSTLSDRAFAVMMDPNEGDVLAMAGKQINYDDPSGEMLDFSYGAFATQYEMGSSVKGATVLAGYQNGMPHGQGYYDRKLNFKDTPEKGSYKNLGYVSDYTALQKSSNVYMFFVAMRIADFNYVENGPINISDDDFRRLRNYYSQFGLGVKTGIDLPQESAGLINDPDQGGKILDIAIGQFDTYTTLQLAQYVSTIANGGYRVEPRVVTSVHAPVEESSLGPVVKEHTSKVLNRVNNTPEDIERVQHGFKLVTSSGTAKNIFNHDVSGKTGTAQALYYGPNKNQWGREVNNLTFVGYYPSTNPEIAFSVAVPWAINDQEPYAKNIASKIVDAYVDLQNQYKNGTDLKATTTDQESTEEKSEAEEQ
ncbi:peptidoglycan D,D-transpeptidase FtsI family protein [Metabacillus herbersteinensis]|uniref:serine-type D-Ala-D-Ala carboxypeptidase n=1 Tax=Metabacillus herbersteinensis TaxID=283816 RepID=A0ABV6GAF1_9BACI